MKKPIALVAAMEEEVDALLAAFPEHEPAFHFNTPLYRARHGGTPLIIAQSGVGKVNAACSLALLLSDFEPRLVVNTGCAGGLQRHHRILDFVVPEEVAYTDVDLTPLGFAYGQMLGSEPRFRACPTLVARFREMAAARPEPPVCHHGLLGSGDSFIHSREQVEAIRAHFGDEVQCVEMEGGAIAHTCTRFGVPFLILRAISDLPAHGDNAQDFLAFLRRAARVSADLCLDFVNHLAQQETP